MLELQIYLFVTFMCQIQLFFEMFDRDLKLLNTCSTTGPKINEKYTLDFQKTYPHRDMSKMNLSSKINMCTENMIKKIDSINNSAKIGALNLTNALVKF